jgi:murein L,D-transpeptidase YcbB/YkuD
MRLRIPLLLLFLLFGALPSSAQQPAPLRLDLNIPALRLQVYEGGELLRSYPVAVGQPGHDTPTGDFPITRAEWNPWWRPPASEWAREDKVTPPGPSNPMGRVKLHFAPLYFIHGTPKEESIGTPASHGCVRMRNKDVIELARLLHERAAPSVPSSKIDRILANPGTTRRIDFQGSIPLVVRYDPVVVEDGELRIYPDIYGYRAIHGEAVYQALLSAGYDIRSVTMDDVQRLLDRAGEQDGVFVVPVEESFGTVVARAAGGRSGS